MSCFITDTYPSMEGIFHIVGCNRKGEIVFDFTEHNLIVDTAKTVLSRLISNPSATSKVITQIGFGSGAVSPTVLDTALTSQFAKPLDGYAYPGSDRVKFNWSLGYGEANGLAITEFGLLAQDGSLFSRKVRGVITKSDDLSLSGDWTIIF